MIWIDPGLDNPFRAVDLAITRATDAGDGRREGALRDVFYGATNHPERKSYSLANRFLGPELSRDLDNGWAPLSPDGRPNLVVFGPGRRWDSNGNRLPDLQDEIVPEDVFPSALRITVDLFDPLQRLERPTRHVMVVPVGS